MGCLGAFVEWTHTVASPVAPFPAVLRSVLAFRSASFLRRSSVVRLDGRPGSFPVPLFLPRSHECRCARLNEIRAGARVFRAIWTESICQTCDTFKFSSFSRILGFIVVPFLLIRPSLCNIWECPIKLPTAVIRQQNKKGESGFPELLVFWRPSASIWPTWPCKGCHASSAFKANSLTGNLQNGVGLGTFFFRTHDSAVRRVPGGWLGAKAGVAQHFLPAVTYPILPRSRRPKTGDDLSHA